MQKGDRLIDLYRGNATTEEALAMKVDIEEGNQIRYENRRFTLDYLKLLGKYLENRYVEVVWKLNEIYLNQYNDWCCIPLKFPNLSTSLFWLSLW